MESFLENQLFKDKIYNEEKLILYGFVEENGIYVYKTNISDDLFELCVYITKENTVNTKLFEIDTNEEYFLHKISMSKGLFVGNIRKEYENILTDIAKRCFDINIYQGLQTQRIINYIKDNHNGELEFLWKKYSDSAIVRRKDNLKWYAVFMKLSKRKLGFNSDEIVEIMDLRFDKVKIDEAVDNLKYFPGWHMNKKSWITIILDNSIEDDELYKLIDDSYELA